MTFPGPEVIKHEFILKLKIKCNDWLLTDTCPQVANHCYFILSLRLYSSSSYNLRAWPYSLALQFTI